MLAQHITTLHKVQLRISKAIATLENEGEVLDVARQLHEIEKIIFETKRELVGEHHDQRLSKGGGSEASSTA